MYDTWVYEGSFSLFVLYYGDLTSVRVSKKKKHSEDVEPIVSRRQERPTSCPAPRGVTVISIPLNLKLGPSHLFRV
jgi:hypothetical protein